MVSLASTLGDTGRSDGYAKCMAAVELLEHDDPSADKVYTLVAAAMFEIEDRGDAVRARQFAERAVTCAEQLGQPDLSEAELARRYAGALMARGCAACLLGDSRGLDDLREADEIGLAANYTLPLLNHGLSAAPLEGPRAAMPVFERAIAVCRAHGDRGYELVARGGLFRAQCVAGLWQDALASADELMQELESAEEDGDLLRVRASLALLLTRCGESPRARPRAEWSLARAQLGDMHPGFLSLALIAAIAVQHG